MKRRRKKGLKVKIQAGGVLTGRLRGGERRKEGEMKRDGDEKGRREK